MRDSVGENAGLPRARSGDDEERSFGRPDRLELGLVEALEEALRRRDGDPSMLAVASATSPRGDRSVDASRDGYQRTVNSKCAGCFPSQRTRHVYVPFGSGS